MDIHGLRHLLNAWVEWRRYGEPFPNACNLGRLRDATGGGVPGSRPPSGVELPDNDVAVLMEAMEIHTLIGHGQYIAAVRNYYRRDKNKTAKDIAAEMGKTLAAFEADKKQGELYLLGWVNAMQHTRKDAA